MIVDIQGFCPMGCGRTLHVGEPGMVYCAAPNCPKPGAVTELLADAHIGDHVVRLHEIGFEITHPLAERLTGQLFDCDFHEWMCTQPGPPADLGEYYVTPGVLAPWVFTRVEQPGVEP